MSYINNPKIVTNGLAICFDASDINSYVSGSPVINDLSGNNNTGLLSGSATNLYPTYTSNFLGGLNFNGTSSVVTLQSETNASSSAYTIETVLSIRSNSTQFTGGNTVNMYIAFRQNRNSSFFEGIQQYYVIGAGSALGTLRSAATNPLTNTAVAISSSLSSFNAPVMLTTTYDSSNLRLYVNGSLQATVATGFALSFNTTNLFKLGRTAVPGNAFDGPLNGIIHSFKLYTRVLSDSEINQNFLTQKSKFNL